MKTLYDKVWESHLVRSEVGKPALLYIDLHLIHEVTSPQAFEGLRIAGRNLRRPDLTFATVDHAIPTLNRSLPFGDPIAAKQVETLRENCREFGVPLYDLDRIEQGIVHVVGPEQGLTRPGMTIVCGDSHTATHGAFGALAFGIGTSEVSNIAAVKSEKFPDKRRRRTSVWRYCERSDPCDNQPDRNQRRNRFCDRIRRFCHPVAFNGRPYDGLQYEYRGRSKSRLDRPRSDNVRLLEGQNLFA
jgi:hypothetical protein